MITRTFALGLTLLLSTTAGCGKSASDAKGLPPATGPQSAPLPTLPAVSAPKAAEDAVRATVTRTTGTLTARLQVDVAARASGTIVELRLDAGDRVKKGDVLFRVDSSDAVLRARQARTQLRGAEVQRSSAKIELDRAKALHAQRAATEQQLQQVQTQYDAAEVAVAQSKTAVAMADKAVSDAVVRSPIDGIVQARKLEKGEYAASSPPSTVLVLQDQSSLELKFRLPERALTDVRAGTPIEVTVPALGLVRSATISQVAPTIDATTRTIELTALLDNKDAALRPGLMAEVQIKPAAAIVTDGANPGRTP